MASVSSNLHNPPSVSSTETPITEHDDVSVSASDDVDVTSTSTTTDLSVTEQDQSMDDKPITSLKNVVSAATSSSANTSRGPVQLLRRQQNTSSPTGMSPQTSRQATPVVGVDGRQPSPTRVESGTVHPSMKETIDPSLLEAFANPMNRQYLLQLEGSLNNFVTQSRTDSMELPPTNSFFRCLAHKMADHYKLQHVADSGHVVLFRSQFARIPETRLSELSKTLRTPGSSASSTVASEDSLPATSNTPEYKIMKRLPGKSAREVEDDAKSESSTSQVLSHEERQAQYEKTRARIFSDYVESQVDSKGSDDAGSESSSMRREKSLHRSDSFQTRQQFARESASLGYSSYAAALTGQQPPQVLSQVQQGPYNTGYNPIQQGYLGYHTYSAPTYPPPQVMYPYPPTMSTASSRDAPSSRPESGTSSPTTTRNDSPGFQPNPFAREFVPIGASGSGSGIRPPPPPPAVRPKESVTTPPVVTPTTTTATSRHSTPPTVTPTTPQVKKTASFENTVTARPITPTPIYTQRSLSASSMRPPHPPPQLQLQQLQQQYPPAYPPPYMISQLPVVPPMLSTAPQRDWGPPITTGTIRYMANGQPSTLPTIDGKLMPVAPQVLPYRAHPMPMPMSPMKPVYAYTAATPTPPSRNGVVMMQDTMETARDNEILGDGNDGVGGGGQKDNESVENVRENLSRQEGNISSE